MRDYYLAKVAKDDFTGEEEMRPLISIEGGIEFKDAKHSFDTGGIVKKVSIGYSEIAGPGLKLYFETESSWFEIDLMGEVATWLLEEMEGLRQKVEDAISKLEVL
jgi:hypothetical protein